MDVGVITRLNRVASRCDRAECFQCVIKRFSRSDQERGDLFRVTGAQRTDCFVQLRISDLLDVFSRLCEVRVECRKIAHAVDRHLSAGEGSLTIRRWPLSGW